jgi:hypothetical protein
MHLITRCLAVGAGVCVLAASPALGAVGMRGSGGSTYVQVSLTDATFDGPDCFEVPVFASFSGPGSVDLTAFRSGSSSTETAYLSSWDSVGTDDGYFFLCPNLDGAGVYTVRGEVDGEDGRGTLSSGEFTVYRADSVMQSLSARQRGSVVTITGRVTADSSRGAIGVPTTITLRARLAKTNGGSGKWKRIGTTYADQFGRFTFKGSTSQNIRNAQVVATAVQTAWATQAQGTATIS